MPSDQPKPSEPAPSLTLQGTQHRPPELKLLNHQLHLDAGHSFSKYYLRSQVVFSALRLQVLGPRSLPAPPPVALMDRMHQAAAMPAAVPALRESLTLAAAASKVSKARSLRPSVQRRSWGKGRDGGLRGKVKRGGLTGQQFGSSPSVF